MLGNTAPDIATAATSGTHPISRAASDERQRLERLEHELDRLQAKLTQVEAERDRLQGELTRALEQIARMPSEPAPQAGIAEVATTLEPTTTAPRLSRIAITTFPLTDPTDRERDGALHGGFEFEVEFLDDTHLFSDLTQDISQGGLFVATYRELALGSRVNLALELSDETVEIEGEVCWARPKSDALSQRPGYGVASRELSSAALAALRELCRAHPPRYYDC